MLIPARKWMIWGVGCMRSNPRSTQTGFEGVECWH
ncbi:hypothetical protein V6Z11_A05G243100 [Gossypium hirsutum]